MFVTLWNIFLAPLIWFSACSLGMFKSEWWFKFSSGRNFKLVHFKMNSEVSLHAFPVSVFTNVILVSDVIKFHKQRMVGQWILALEGESEFREISGAELSCNSLRKEIDLQNSYAQRQSMKRILVAGKKPHCLVENIYFTYSTLRIQSSKWS